MAEIVATLGAGIAIAGLSSACIKMMSGIGVALSMYEDYKVVLAMLKIEQCKLYNWQEAMGFSRSHQQRNLVLKEIENSPIGGAISECLESIRLLLTNTKRIHQRQTRRKKKICMKLNAKGACFRKPKPLDLLNAVDETESNSESEIGSKTPSSEHLVLEDLQRYFNDMSTSAWKRNRPLALHHRLRWVISDKKEFKKLVLDLRSLIDGLVNITQRFAKPDPQKEMLCRVIVLSSSLDTLRKLYELFASDSAYRYLADRVSNRIASIASTPPRLLNAPQRHSESSTLQVWVNKITSDFQQPTYINDERWLEVVKTVVNGVNALSHDTAGLPFAEATYNVRLKAASDYKKAVRKALQYVGEIEPRALIAPESEDSETGYVKSMEEDSEGDLSAYVQSSPDIPSPPTRPQNRKLARPGANSGRKRTKRLRLDEPEELVEVRRAPKRACRKE